MKDSKIAWTDNTFNPWWGCQRVSPGCENCYAEAFAKRTGHGVWGPTAERRFFADKHWDEPLKWNAEAKKAGVRARVFCSSMSDVFEDRDDLLPHRNRLFALIEETPSLDWQLLTKRPENMVQLAPLRWAAAWPDNVWAGTTCEDQAHAQKRLLWLCEVPAVVRFVSYEPALGPLDLRRVEQVKPEPPHGSGVYLNALTGHVIGPDDMTGLKIQWVIAGGESGGNRRPCEVSWFEDVARQCSEAGVAFFMKQDSGLRPGGQGRIPDALYGHKEFPR